MKNKINSLVYMIIGVTFSFLSCNKEGFEKSDFDFGNEDHVMTLESGYISNIVTALEKPSDYEYYTKGIIEYSINENLIATVDYGDGAEDVWAKLYMNGIVENIDLSAKKKDSKYTKVITKPLIKIKGCDYIVEGTIKYFQDKEWVATVDYGDGTCDEWATKKWKDGFKTFSMKKK